MKRTTITLPPGLATLVADDAHSHRTSVSEIIRRVLNEHYHPSGQRAIGFAGICDEPKLPSGAELESELDEWEAHIAGDS